MKKKRKKLFLFKMMVLLKFCVFLFSHNPTSDKAAYLPDRDNGYLNIKYVQPQYPVKRDFSPVKPWH